MGWRGWISPHFFQMSISPWKNGARGNRFLDFSWFIISYQKIFFHSDYWLSIRWRLIQPPSLNRLKSPTYLRCNEGLKRTWQFELNEIIKDWYISWSNPNSWLVLGGNKRRTMDIHNPWVSTKERESGRGTVTKETVP